MLYTQDYDESYPPQDIDPFGQSPYAVQDSPGRSSWMGLVQTYLKSIEAGVCPSTPEKFAAGDSVPTKYSRTSYCYNGLLSALPNSQAATANPPPISAIALVPRPAETMLIEDVGWTWSRSQPQPVVQRHRQCDGHADP